MIATVADSYDLRRWVLSAAVVVGLHAALVVMLTTWHEQVAGDEGSEAIVVDLAPYTGPSTESKTALGRGPEKKKTTATPDVQPPRPEKNRKETTERPRVLPDADVQLPLEVKPLDKPVEQPSPPVSQAT